MEHIIHRFYVSINYQKPKIQSITQGSFRGSVASRAALYLTVFLLSESVCVQLLSSSL